MDITGKVAVIMSEQQVSDKFKKREFVLTDDSSQYPQHILFQTIQDKTSLLDKFKEGDEIKVYFNLRGRKYEKDSKTSYFNSLEAWRIEKIGEHTETSVAESKPSTEDDSNLPF